jgi:hypothetical protein
MPGSFIATFGAQGGAISGDRWRRHTMACVTRPTCRQCCHRTGSRSISTAKTSCVELPDAIMLALYRRQGPSALRYRANESSSPAVTNPRSCKSRKYRSSCASISVRRWGAIVVAQKTTASAEDRSWLIDNLRQRFAKYPGQIAHSMSIQTSEPKVSVSKRRCKMRRTAIQSHMVNRMGATTRSATPSPLHSVRIGPATNSEAKTTEPAMRTLNM